jgi:CRP-like cAMP-binding protein
MPDFNPHSLRRILLLRHFPMLGSAELGELAMVAENVVEKTFPIGSTMAAEGRQPSAVHFIVSGRVGRSGHEPLGPRTVLGALEVFAGCDMHATAVAEAETNTLQLHPTDLAELLEDNFGLMRATVRDLAARLVTQVPPPIGSPIVVVPGTALGLVERLMLLRGQVTFSGVRLEALAALAHASHEVRWRAGEVVARAGEPATGAYIIATGELRTDDARILKPGHAIGSLETLGEVNHISTIVAETEVHALACSATAIFDVIEDHADFGIAMIASFADALLAVPHVTVN